MKRSLLFILLFSLSVSLSAQEAILKLASDPWPPFTNVEEKGALAFDLVKFALKRSGRDVEF